MSRTTEAAVKGILLRDYDSVNLPSLTPFIDTATLIVDGISTYATNNGPAVSAAQLEIVERWLSAHFFKMSDRPYKQKSTAGSSASFDGNTGMGFDATLYGQMAKRLDPTGYLKQQDAMNSTRGSLTGAGKPPSEQVAYWDRD